MSEVSYVSCESAGVPVRADLVEAQQRAWQRLASPGTWWTGAERVAVAAEVRNAEKCPLCAERRAALSPHAVAGEHAAQGGLPAAAVDAAHRIASDPGRLTRAWLDRTLAAGLEEGAYVELVGIVATVVNVDSFCRALGVAPHPLPEPRSGEPSRYRPPGARPDGAWVPMIPARDATGSEADLYGGRRTGNVLRALSLVPDEVRNLKDLSAAHYVPWEEIASPRPRSRALDRTQMELVAARVSARNECFY